MKTKLTGFVAALRGKTANSRVSKQSAFMALKRHSGGKLALLRLR
jgi:hypothetical protein